MSNEFIINIENVSKKFGDFTAVDNVNLKINRGEFFSLLGSSGCGKTTLLRMLAGFEFPTEGEIYIDDQPVSQMPPNQRPTNMVFQSYAIFPHLTVADNIVYGLRKKGYSKDELRAMAEDSLEKIRLPGYGDRRSDQLSGGQRQRIALARALIMQPKVLLLDEPLGALDKKLREEMQLELRQLQRDVGITFIFVTHDQEEALSMSDRIAVMSAGKVLQVAGPRELYEQPNCTQVADFIGTINFMDAMVKGINGTNAVIEAVGIGTQEVPLPDDSSFIAEGKTIKAAIRPEKILVSSEKPADNGQTIVHGKVRTSAYLGDRSHHYVTVDGRDTPFSVAAQKIDRSVTESMSTDQQVWISWAKDAVVLLPNS